MKISVMGGGYVGLATGICFAHVGHDVTIIEINSEKVQEINNGQPPFYKNGLETLLKHHAGKNLQASTDFDTHQQIVF